MMKVSVIEKPPAWNQAQTAAWALLWRDKKALLALVYLVALYGVALLAPLFIGDQISRIDFGSSLLPPSLTAGGHILGTDTLGRDLFLRILFAARISLFISATVVIGSSLLGVLLGIVAGYYGGRLDEIIMRLIDLMMAFPGLLLV
ncbi:MAG: peptide ABC transporter permease, partial [Anaerolineae bacterium]|nr:peptide ABC transporter permease [Anaerolineae bacterium]